MGVDTLSFTGLCREWAEIVARRVDDFAGDRSPEVEELWVSHDLALFVRYRVGTDHLGARFRLDEDPTSGLEPTDAATLASILLHNLHAASDFGWVDDDGYCWWGDRPPTGWPYVEATERILTVRRPGPAHDGA